MYLVEWKAYVWLCVFRNWYKQHIAGLVVNYGISNTIVLEIP